MPARVKLRDRELKDGRRTLYLDCYDSGRRWLEYLSLYLVGDRERDKETRRLAEAREAQRKLELAASDFELPLRTRLRADFVGYCRELGKSKRARNTRQTWDNAVMHLIAFGGEPLPFAKLNGTFFEGFRDYLLSRLKQNSAQVYFGRIKAAARRAAAPPDRILQRDPTERVTIKYQETRREYLELPELRRLARAACGSRETRNAFLFSAFSGMRLSDVRPLTWASVRGRGNVREVIFSQTKTGDEEALPLSPEAWAILTEQRRQHYGASVPPGSDLVFHLKTSGTCDKAIRKWAARAGIGKRVSFHTARHTFATLSLTSGVDLYTVSKLLGHRHVSTTEIYAKVINDKKRAAVAMLPRLGGRNVR